MDISFKTKEGRFNYRVGAIMIHEQKVLMMKDEGSSYFYVPGGRVKINETAETAVLRELKEELGIDGEIIRPLWLNQSFFEENVTHELFHELCLYYLVDISKNDGLFTDNTFISKDHEQLFRFEWISFDRVSQEYLYPSFLKKKIFHLPEHLEILCEYE